MKSSFIAALLMLCGIVTTQKVSACTDIIVGRKATADGSVLMSYSADAFGWFTNLHYVPAADHHSGEKREIRDCDSGKPLGSIDEVSHTYQVVSYTNEWQLAIGESTCETRKGMVDETGVIDYGSLINIALERAKNAREAIKVMTELVEKYGYYSEGETFSICDPNEAWLLYMAGCGSNRFVSPERTVWVAVRVPDEAVAAHANYFRLSKFLDGRFTRLAMDELQTKYPADDDNVPSLMVCSPNVVSFAHKMGWYDGTDADFCFSDVYSPFVFFDFRLCEPRVWSIYNRFADNMEQYIGYAAGTDRQAEPLPLWVVPNKKLTPDDVRTAMRDHFEGTPFDNSGTILGGWFDSPYAVPPLEYEVDGQKYFNERPVSTMQAASVIVAQLRSWVPRELGRCWFGNDDANMVAMTPVYNCITRVPRCYTGEGAGNVEFSMDNAYWVSNWVSNMVYTKYSMMFPTLQTVRDSLEASYTEQLSQLEQQALALSGDARRELLTDYSCKKADEMINRWRKLAFHLIVKYNDMVVRPTNPDGSFKVDEWGHVKDLQKPGMSESFTRAHVQLTGDRYLNTSSDPIPSSVAPIRISRSRSDLQGTYRLSGIRAEQPAKGVNIKDGKKYVTAP